MESAYSAVQPGASSAPGHLTYAEIVPDAALVDLVDRFYVVGNPTACRTPLHGVADAGADLLLDLDGRVAPLVSVTLARPLVGPMPAGSRVLGVRLRPGIAPAWLGSEAAALDGSVTPLAAFRAGRGAPALGRGLDAGQAVAIVTAWLSDAIGRMPRHREAREIIGEAWSAGVAVTAPRLSARHARRRCRAILAIGPKRLARVLRFQRAFRALASNPASAIADVAAAHDYADQAHFTRECSSFSGLTPGVWRGRFLQDGPHPDR